ncbi:hypothetical protein AAG906_020093 [Vitis piasezkii]
MKVFVYLGKKLEHFFSYCCTKLSCFQQYFLGVLSSLFHFLVFHVNPMWIHLSYYITLSLVGYIALKVSKLKTTSFRSSSLDLFFTSMSASTVSSMSTMEMEVFSNIQLVIMTILMLLGREIFTSFLRLQLLRSKYFTKRENIETRVHVNASNVEKFCLSCVIFCYILVVHLIGSALILLYLSLVPSAREVLNKKGLSIQTFSIFTTVSTFSNCGFIPTNENMMIFKKNSDLLLLLIPQVLLGNTLFAPCLRFLIWVLEKSSKRVEFSYMLKNSREIGYSHLLPSLHSSFLVITVFLMILVQVILFGSMEWNSEVVEGLNTKQKLVASLFQVVNSRHTGESVFDLSTISPAVLVLFVVMMYLPAYTSFLPIHDCQKALKDGKRRTKRNKLLEYLPFSQLSYLVLFIILICITERDKMREDPLNFNVLNVTIEVVSAYGNVGFSTGYSCAWKLKPDPSCKDAWYGFVGRWSDKGKLILILIMFIGKLKNFSIKVGRA